MREKISYIWNLVLCFAVAGESTRCVVIYYQLSSNGVFWGFLFWKILVIIYCVVCRLASESCKSRRKLLVFFVVILLIFLIHFFFFSCCCCFVFFQFVYWCFLSSRSGGRTEGAYSIVAWLSRMTADDASLTRRSRWGKRTRGCPIFVQIGRSLIPEINISKLNQPINLMKTDLQLHQSTNQIRLSPLPADWAYTEFGGRLW